MSSQTNEAALEACIERALTGGVSVVAKGAVIQEPTPDYGGNGWKRGRPSDFNAEFAVDEAMLWQFLESMQAKELEKLHHKPDWNLPLGSGLQKLESQIQTLQTIRCTLIANAVTGKIKL
jgi:type I restriction enzyme R subunit